MRWQYVGVVAAILLAIIYAFSLVTGIGVVDLVVNGFTRLLAMVT